MNITQGLVPATGNQMEARQLGSMSLGIQRQVRREIERAQAQAVMAKLHEDARAMLTHTALEHVSALSALEEHCLRVAPLGEARYREIVDSYAIGAAAAVRRWN
ncbi:hypothetical protein [Microbacterium alcoholitolerans]|uniref:hypothetical protein n=1 Tax=unclassified Microbacterium TaxID=2609290 RepID=UPI003D170541